MKKKKSKKDKRLGRSVPADHAALGHNNTWGPLPLYYVDKGFTCKDCGKKSVWTAKEQKFYYEVAKGSIHARASRCLTCRKQRKEDIKAQKEHMEEMAKQSPHPNEAFFQKVKKKEKDINFDDFWKDLADGPLHFLEGDEKTKVLITSYFDRMKIEIKKGQKLKASTTIYFELIEDLSQELIDLCGASVFEDAYPSGKDWIKTEIKNTLNFAFMSGNEV